MWYAGKLATSHREKFVKFYDLGERIFPDLQDQPSEAERTDWLNRQALDRLSFGSVSEVRKFWQAVDLRQTPSLGRSCARSNPG